MKNNGVMFKVTAKNCKEWADAANDDAYDSVLERITKAAREGKYNIVIDNLSDGSKSKLEDNGFMVVAFAGDWQVSWF